jgi:hypothetical protein
MYWIPSSGFIEQDNIGELSRKESTIIVTPPAVADTLNGSAVTSKRSVMAKRRHIWGSE